MTTFCLLSISLNCSATKIQHQFDMQITQNQYHVRNFLIAILSLPKPVSKIKINMH